MCRPVANSLLIERVFDFEHISMFAWSGILSALRAVLNYDGIRRIDHHGGGSIFIIFRNFGTCGHPGNSFEDDAGLGFGSDAEPGFGSVPTGD